MQTKICDAENVVIFKMNFASLCVPPARPSYLDKWISFEEIGHLLQPKGEKNTVGGGSSHP